MINEKVITTARHLVGQHLKNIREEKQLTYYAVAKLAGMSIGQVQGVESGETAYTLDSFLKITHALDCYFFLEDKDGKHLDFADMAEKSLSSNPSVMRSADGHSVNNTDDHWTVNCPTCEREIEYTGYFDSGEINKCKCGTEFKTRRVYFDNDSYME